MNWNEWFYYKDGQLYWKVSTSNVKENSIAGFYSNGYRQVMLKGKSYPIHRIIYEMLVNSIPKGYQVDHINGIKDDNRLENLRLATNSENGRNRGVNKNNKIGVKGVSWREDKKKYHAQIQMNGVKKRLGYFDTIEEAANAYQKVAKEWHGEFYRS